MKLKRRRYHYLRRADIGVGLDAVEIIDNGLQGLRSGYGTSHGVGHPLTHAKVLLRGIGIVVQNHAYVVEALEGAHAGGANGNNRCRGIAKFHKQAARDRDKLGVHVVPAYGFAFHRLKCSGAHMEC